MIQNHKRLLIIMLKLFGISELIKMPTPALSMGLGVLPIITDESLIICNINVKLLNINGRLSQMHVANMNVMFTINIMTTLCYISCLVFFYIKQLFKMMFTPSNTTEKADKSSHG